MLSLRSVRSAIIRCARVPASPATCGSAWAARLHQYSAPQHLPTIQLSRSFTISARYDSQVNQELSSKLDSELSVEREMRDPDAMPEHIKEYLDNSPFEIQDSPGKEEVALVRKFGDETIKVTFSIDDLNNVDEDLDQMQEDNSMMDEMDDPTDMPTNIQSGGANTKGHINQGRTAGGNIRVAPEDHVAPADRPELIDDEAHSSADEENEPSFTTHVSVHIERASKGALQIEAIAQDGLMVIDNVYYYKDAKLANAKDTDGDVYTGPPFANLDEDLQVLFERYLDERGINTTMALFIPEYIDFKEQKEYMDWLSNVKRFVE